MNGFVYVDRSSFNGWMFVHKLVRVLLGRRNPPKAGKLLLNMLHGIMIVAICCADVEQLRRPLRREKSGDLSRGSRSSDARYTDLSVYDFYARECSVILSFWFSVKTFREKTMKIRTIALTKPYELFTLSHYYYCLRKYEGITQQFACPSLAVKQFQIRISIRCVWF